MRPELVRLLSELIAVPSPVGRSAAEAQTVVSQYLEQIDYRVEVTEDDPMALADHPEFTPPGPDARGPAVNVVGSPSAGGAPRLALFAHIDSERPSDAWSTPPHEPTIAGSRIYGLGSADDKGGVAAMLVAARMLQASGGPAPTVMCLHGKGGGSRGSLPAFVRLGDVDAVLYLHPAETGRGMADVKHVVRGALDVTLTVRGWQGEPFEIGSPQSARFADGGDALQACLAVIDGMRQTALRGYEVNVGRLDAGERSSTVPDECRAQVRVLFDEPQTASVLLRQLESALAGYRTALVSARGAFDLELAVSGFASNPASAPWGEASSVAVRASIEAVMGTAPAPHTRHVAGDIRYPMRITGAPAFGIGSLGGNFYGPDEWVDVDDLVNLVAVTVLTLERWARR